MSNITEKDLVDAKNILGDIAKDWTDEQLKNELVKINYLVESWLDDFEKRVFEGKTLAETISEISLTRIVKKPDEEA